MARHKHVDTTDDFNAQIEGDQPDSPPVVQTTETVEPEIPGWWVRAYGVGVPYAPNPEPEVEAEATTKAKAKAKVFSED